MVTDLSAGWFGIMSLLVFFCYRFEKCQWRKPMGKILSKPRLFKNGSLTVCLLESTKKAGATVSPNAVVLSLSDSIRSPYYHNYIRRLHDFSCLWFTGKGLRISIIKIMFSYFLQNINILEFGITIKCICMTTEFKDFNSLHEFQDL